MEIIDLDSSSDSLETPAQFGKVVDVSKELADGSIEIIDLSSHGSPRISPVKTPGSVQVPLEIEPREQDRLVNQSNQSSTTKRPRDNSIIEINDSLPVKKGKYGTSSPFLQGYRNKLKTSPFSQHDYIPKPSPKVQNNEQCYPGSPRHGSKLMKFNFSNNPDNSLDLISLGESSDSELVKSHTQGKPLAPIFHSQPVPTPSVSKGSKPKLSNVTLDKPDSDPVFDSSFSFEPPVNPKRPQKSKLAKPLHVYDNGDIIEPKLFEKVNRNKTDRVELLKEMTIIIPQKIFEFIDEEKLAKKFMEEVDEKGKRVSSPQKGKVSSQIVLTTKIIKVPSNSPYIRWKRYIEGKYDASKDVYIPCTPTYIEENCRILFFLMNDFLTLNDNDLRTYFRPNTILFLGKYYTYINELKRQEEKEYKERVLSLLLSQSSTSSVSKVQELEYRLNKLQYELNMNIIFIKSPEEMIEILQNFTYSIAFSQYDKYQRNPEFGNVSKPKVGQDLKSTFIECIKSFKLMTTPKGELLYHYYDSLHKVYERFRNGRTLGNDGDGRNLVPPSIEDAMKRFFTSNDENEIFYN